METTNTLTGSGDRVQLFKDWAFRFFLKIVSCAVLTDWFVQW